MAVRPPVLDGEVLALHPAKITQPLLEDLVLRRRASAERQVANQRQLPRLLRVGGERRREDD